MNKREFIKAMSLSIGALSIFGISSCKTGKKITSTKGSSRSTDFELPPLPYSYKALEPYIDEQTMTIHHQKHHAAYIAKLNEALRGTVYERAPLDQILADIGTSSPSSIRNNAGAHYNHSFFWESMTPGGSTISDPNFSKAIQASFGTIEDMKEQFSTASKNLFGSGWTWLCMDLEQKLFITTTANQDNPRMSKLNSKYGMPLLAIDLWEHAYYLRYQNKRADYIANFFNIINWKVVEKRFQMQSK